MKTKRTNNLGVMSYFFSNSKIKKKSETELSRSLQVYNGKKDISDRLYGQW